MKHRKSIKNLYSPYRKNKEESMEVWYERYLSDESRYLNLNGHIYSKIIERNEFHENPGFSLLVVFEPLENIEIASIKVFVYSCNPNKKEVEYQKKQEEKANWYKEKIYRECLAQVEEVLVRSGVICSIIDEIRRIRP